MPLKTLPILIAIVLTVTGSTFFLNRNHAGTVTSSFRNNQALYAEIATTSIQTVPALPYVASSTATVHVPVLVYHIVRPAYATDSKAVRGLAQTPEVFDAEMTHLSTAGYHLVSFRDLENYFKNGAPLPSKPIILSFDDGWSDQFTYAFPILVKHNYKATFFVFTNAIGRRGFVSLDNLYAMRDAGMTIGSHSRSHPFLKKITDTAALWKEIDGSKKLLESKLGTQVTEFAYPFGQYNPAIVEMVQKAGYASARGDVYSGDQSLERLYMLSALNAPTTAEAFVRKFP